MRSQEKLFTASVLIEVAAGLPMVSLPALALWLLLGVREPSPEALIASRLGGAGLLAISGSMLRMAGVALWPAVALHAVMTIWCALKLRAWHARAEPTSSISN